MMSLNELKALIHERCTVDGNLGAHLPSWMCQGVVGRNVFELLARISEERTTRAGKPNPLDISGVLANKALEDGTVLGVNRNELARLNQRHQKVSTNNNGLLVGVCQHLASLYSGKTSVNASLSHHCVDHAVNLIQHSERLNSLRTKACLAVLRQCVEKNVALDTCIGKSNIFAVELICCLHGKLSRRPHRKGNYLHLLREMTAYIKRLHAHRARSSKDSNT